MTNEEVLVAIAGLIGTAYSEDTKRRITECTARARVVGPHDITTKEFDESRVQVITGGNGLIEGFRFG